MMEVSCYRIKLQGSEDLPALQCKQEADGHTLLHASYAKDEGYTRSSAVIHSEDTDVFIMAIAFENEIGTSLYIKYGTKNRTKLIDINKIASAVGQNVCKAVVGMHAYTGCDTVSAFAGKRKAQALKLLKDNKEVRDTFTKLG